MTTTALLDLENIVTTPIEPGDAGVILKADGSFKVFSTAGAEAHSPDTITEAQMLQARKLQALALVLSSDQVMEQLMQLVDDAILAGVEIINPGAQH